MKASRIRNNSDTPSHHFYLKRIWKYQKNPVGNKQKQKASKLKRKDRLCADNMTLHKENLNGSIKTNKICCNG